MADITPEVADKVLREEDGFPPTKHNLHFNVVETERSGVFVLSVYKGIESYLGEELFEQLEELFSDEAGVVEAEHVIERYYFSLS
ncbi:hypothetical protein ACJJIG_18110 [Microbulbifer sp. SSSA007]|uniref:hypothetical protein n=1 Tax=Microbulbifer sp. SSSA007 TaxID=3243379 RepID=UPI00403A3C42